MGITWQNIERAIFKATPGHFLTEIFWYAIFATSMWVAFYWLFARWMKGRRISTRRLDSKRIAWEVVYSFRSMFLFGVTAGFVAIAILSGWTKLYFEIDRYSLTKLHVDIDDGGWTWVVASVVILIFAHDTYFYWTHRAMHHPMLFRRVHRLHHLSTNPTPWAAYSFSVPEAFVQAGVVPLMLFLIPIHPLALVAFGVYRHFFSILGHSGHEIFPKWFIRSPLGWFFNTNTHHHQHHEVFNANYGLYFNFWDRLMGTNHVHYVERFEEVVNRKARSAAGSSARITVKEDLARGGAEDAEKVGGAVGLSPS